MIDTIICGDCLDVMRDMPSGSIDLIITSPPYNLGISSGGGMRQYTNGPLNSGKWKYAELATGYGCYDDALPYDKYVTWQKQVLTECWRVICDGGAIFYNHKPRVQNGQLQIPLELNPDLPLRQIIIWVRSGGINFNPTYYLPCHEWVMLFAKPDFRLKSQGASGVKDVWEIMQERDNPHPAPFPIELPMKILETVNAQIIFDPFIGSGTTAVAALKLSRHFYGCDVNPEYVKLANQRIEKTRLELSQLELGITT